MTSVEGGADAQWSWLVAAASEGRAVAWLVGEDGEPALLRLVADQLAREPRPAYEVEIVHGSYDVPGARLIDLVQVMDRLRRNCPWDQEQTHESLAKYLLEETYETLEAIDTGDYAHLREELGDLLLQVAFHSRIAEEASRTRTVTTGLSIDDVAAGIVEKLIRRHPHVFADVAVDGVADVEANWETIKAAEKQRSSVLEGIPVALPALALADKVLSRAVQGSSGGGDAGDRRECGRGRVARPRPAGPRRRRRPRAGAPQLRPEAGRGSAVRGDRLIALDATDWLPYCG